jgi:1-acyl-sn-glycerol-3-phosphate acyltransferase
VTRALPGPAAVWSALVWTAIALLLVVAFVIDVALLPTIVVDRRRYVIAAFHGWVGRQIVRINPFWRVRVVGETRAPRGTYVVCANHQSNADIFCLFFVRGNRWRWLAKRSLLRVPVFGWLMQIGGHISVERGERASGERALAQCRRWLERGVSVAFFPEGTRSETGEIKDFKMGAFRLAVDAQVPVLPIAITGTRDALPKHGWVMRERAEVRIRVLTPIPPGQDPDALRTQVRTHLVEATQRGQVLGS